MSYLPADSAEVRCRGPIPPLNAAGTPYLPDSAGVPVASGIHG
jgi:hypothetical protein